MSWQEKIKNRLPNLVISKYWWVQGNILIDDLDLAGLGLDADVPSLRVISHLITPSTLNGFLLKVFPLETFPIIIWPGEGAKVVQKSLDCRRGINIPTQRIGYANPAASVAEFEVPAGNVAIVDDVISSGHTAWEIWRKGKLTKASLAAWLMQSPQDKLLNCYEKIFAGLLVRNEQGKVPINSLSTFLQKSDVLQNYASRFANSPREFINFFSWLKEEGVRRAI